MQATESEDRAAEREMRKIEMEREVTLRELELREKELTFHPCLTTLIPTLAIH
jgi:hypothetical protein